MALQFNPYPITQPQVDPHPVAVAGDRFQKMLALLGEYQMQKSAAAQQKEQARQQQALEYIKLKADYGEDINGPLQAAGLNFPGLGAPPPGAPATPPTPPAGPDGALGITPEFIANLRKKKGRVGADQYMKDQQFMLNSEKDRLDIESKQKRLTEGPEPKSLQFVGTQGELAVLLDPNTGQFVNRPLPGQGQLMPRNAPVLPASQAAELGEFQSLVNQLQVVKTTKKPEYIGPVDSRSQSVRQTTGFGASTEAAQFKGALAGVKNKLLNLYSGAAISPSEYQRLLEQLPDEAKSEVDFEAKLALFETTLNNVLATKKGAFTSAGYAPMKAASGGAPAIVAAPTTTSALPPDKQARLAELRAKRDAGLLR